LNNPDGIITYNYLKNSELIQVAGPVMSFSPSSNETSLRRLWYFATFVIDLDRRDLRCNGERVRLTAKPFDTLALLIENRGQVVTRDQLRAIVWEGVNVSDPAIEHAVNKVRKALGDDTANPQFIHTLWGKGYIFAADVGVQPPLVVPPQPQEETKAGGGGDPKDLGTQGAITMVEDGPDCNGAQSLPA
jgi:DNA-binding winged helix-turn-helix (wHTH) protein